MALNFVRCACVLAGALVLASLGSLHAQDLQIAPPPRIVVTGGAEQPVRLQSVRVDAEIAGGLALTRVEMVFFNPNRRILEGELQFPLLDGQAIVGFALDFDGRLREAVPVEKARGQAVFEDITRARVDPALVQATQGNNFKLRVYPLAPGKTRTVVIRYSESLGTALGRRAYRLALGYAEYPHAVSVRARVRQSGAAPSVPADALERFRFRRAGADWVADYEKQFAGERRVLEFSVPAARGPVAHTQERDGKTYFFAEIPVPVESAPRPAPRAIAIAWDSSGSGETRDHAKELALLGAYLRWMRNGEVFLVRVRERAEATERFRVADGDWSALRRTLETTVYDGATQLGAFAAPAQADEVLLFSDGLSNFGDRRPDARGKPMHAISASSRSDPAALRALAEASGGRYVDLLAETPREAARKLTRQWTRVVAIDADGAAQIARESSYPRQGRIALAGILERASARLRVELAVPGRGIRTVEVPLRTSAAPGALAAGLWARLRLAELEDDYALHRAEILRLGKAFGLVTRETSLIVLDRVEDYVRNEIVPPEELRAEYDRLVRVAVQRRESDWHAHLERIVKLFDDKQAWWNGQFPKGDKPAAIASGRDAVRANESRAPAAPGPARERRELLRQDEAPRPAAPAMQSGVRSSTMADAVGASAGAAKSAAAANTTERAIAIQLKPWAPDAAYARRMREADAKDVYRIYLDEKPGYAASTAFFLDAADLLLEKGQKEMAIRVLGNLAEMDLENRHVLRILGYRLLQAGEPALAVPVFRKVAELAPAEPQSWRDLGLALAADKQPQKALDALSEVVARPWDARFPEIELIALAELNAIVAQSQAAGEKLDTARIDPRLLRNLPLDLRVILTWDADNTDIDLWVTDPNGEKAYYGNRLSYQGGRMSRDFTGGYGPEEFSLRGAKPGKYKIEAQFYGHRQQIVAGATTLQVKLTTHFGSQAAHEQLVTLRLKGQGEVVHVGEFAVQ